MRGRRPKLTQRQRGEIRGKLEARQRLVDQLEKLPTPKQLAEQYGVSENTIYNAAKHVYKKERP